MADHQYLVHLTKDSTAADVGDWLRERGFDEVVISNFEEESIDGEDFYSMEMWMIERLVKKLKMIKKFRALWSRETTLSFDGSGMPVASMYQSQVHSELRQSIQSADSPNIHRSPLTPTNRNQETSQICNTLRTPTGRGRSGEKVQLGWAQAFEIPEKFSIHLETGLLSGTMTPSQRNEFLRDICTLISTNTRYPTEEERRTIAQKIVEAYPFLKDTKIGNTSTEWGSWEQKIKHRMKRLQRSTVKRTLVTPAKDKQVPTKKQKRSQAWQSIPAMGEGESEETLKGKEKQLKKICRQSRTDQALVKSLMSSTFPLRRKGVIEGTDTVEELLGNYPPLLKPVHIKLEMCRVMADDSVTRVMKERMEDTWLPKILQHARTTEKPAVRKVLNEMEESVTLAQISEKECHQRAAIWLMCNVFLKSGGGKKNSGEEKLLRLVKGEENVDSLILKVTSPVILLCGEDLFNLDLIYIVAETKIICDASKDDKVLDALILLFCSYFVYNFDYTFQRNLMLFMQSGMLGVNCGNPPVSVSQFFNTLQMLG